MNIDELARKIAQIVAEDTKYLTAIIGFIGVLCGSAITIFGNIVLHRLDAKKERQQQILKKELDRLYRLEELAGEITEWAGSWQLSNQKDELKEKIQKLMIAAGTFRKYPELKQTIRDLNQYAMILIDDREKHEDSRESSKELEEKYQDFIVAYESVLESIKT